MKYLEKHPMIMIVIGVIGISLSSIFVKYSTAPASVTAAFRLLWTGLLMTPVVLGKKEIRKEFLMKYSIQFMEGKIYEDFFFTTTGLNFYFSPYEIAPYSSGIITIEIPYHQLTGLLHDSYFPAERDQINGRMHWDFSSSLEMGQFNSMTEIELSEVSDPVMLYPKGTVEDIRITVAGDGMNIPDYTIFASQKLSDGDAIVLNVTEEELSRISVSYYSGNLYEQLNISD